ncbi:MULTISPECIES: glycosyltransferase [Sphingobacterium]|uniref:Glycosyltransferase n=1 Tax=Sphingobacterium populi TaxID=1812824 RepID=A0ABW5UE10_9SPHI|nr:glycosyltransferase [Sphingobacterium sp. CFCC 11742]
MEKRGKSTLGKQKEEKKHVLFVITGLRMGGAEMQCLLLTKALIERDYSVSVAVMEPNGILIPEFKRCGSKVYELGGKSKASLINGLLKLIRIIYREKPDVVHSHMIHANFFTRFARIFCPIKKLICTAHNISEGGRAMMNVYHYTDFLSDANTNVSKEALEEYIKRGYFSKKKAVLITNAIDTTYFRYDPFGRESIRKELELDANKFVFLAVGRLHDQKDYPNLLYAYKKIVEDNEKVHLLIVGIGDKREEIENLITSLDLCAHISMLGIRTDIPKVMSASDCFVLSSAYEGFGLVVAEALSCELSVVATDAGGVKEVLGGHGKLIPTRDTESLYKVMSESLNEKRVSNTSGRDYIVQRYDIQRLIKKWLDLYGI